MASSTTQPSSASPAMTFTTNTNNTTPPSSTNNTARIIAASGSPDIVMNHSNSSAAQPSFQLAQYSPTHSNHASASHPTTPQRHRFASTPVLNVNDAYEHNVASPRTPRAEPVINHSPVDGQDIMITPASNRLQHDEIRPIVHDQEEEMIRQISNDDTDPPRSPSHSPINTIPRELQRIASPVSSSPMRSRNIFPSSRRTSQQSPLIHSLSQDQQAVNASNGNKVG